MRTPDFLKKYSLSHLFHKTYVGILVQNEGTLIDSVVLYVDARIICICNSIINANIIHCSVHYIKCWYYPHLLYMGMRCYQNYTRIILISNQDITGASQQLCITRIDATLNQLLFMLVDASIIELSNMSSGCWYLSLHSSDGQMPYFVKK